MKMFEVGQRVVNNRDQIGIIKRITPSGMIVVSYGKYETRYRKDGWATGNESVYYKTFIRPLTEEKEKKIKEDRLIWNCIFYFDNNHNLLTAEKAKKILEILGVEVKN